MPHWLLNVEFKLFSRNYMQLLTLVRNTYITGQTSIQTVSSIENKTKYGRFDLVHFSIIEYYNYLVFLAQIHIVLVHDCMYDNVCTWMSMSTHQC